MLFIFIFKIFFQFFTWIKFCECHFWRLFSGWELFCCFGQTVFRGKCKKSTGFAKYDLLFKLTPVTNCSCIFCLCTGQFLIARFKASNFIKKETPTQVFSCKYCGIFKNTYFEELLRTTCSQDRMTLSICLSP